MTQDFDAATLAADYWSTSIIDIHPGSINVRGFPIQELIGSISFPQMIWLMLRGELPDKTSGEPVRSSAGSVGRSRAARAVHRHFAHGHELRFAAERRDGIGNQCARRRSRRRGSASG